MYPSPALAPFAAGTFNVAADPMLKIHRVGSSDPIATVDNVWNSSNEQEIHDAARRVGAFPFAQGSLDAAIVLALEPGGYTAVVENLAGEDGVALLEIYELSPGK